MKTNLTKIVFSTLIISFLWGGVNAQVGIGTTSPSNDLDVEGSGAAATAIDINNTSTGDPKINLQISGTTTFSIGIDNSDSDKLKIGTSALETNTRFTIDASGNCGIGTSSPTATLDVDGNAIFNESGAAKDFRIESDANTHHFYVDGTNNEIGVNTSTPNSTLDIQGSMGLKVTTITSATTINQTHNVVLCNTGPYTVTLPAAASNTGKVYYIKNIDADGDDITVDGNASETIDGDLTFKLDPYKHAVRIVSDGTSWHVLEEAGQLSSNNNNNSFTPINCDGTIFTWNNVTNSTTGKTWMDRNLGAKQVATNSYDADSYGDYYQWGRLKDGHQCRYSLVTSTASKNDVPYSGKLIVPGWEWRVPQNGRLWQGVAGINNPCPSGYRLPTETELNNERLTWSIQDYQGAFASVLKLPAAGWRELGGGVYNAYYSAYYWSSTVHSGGVNIRSLGFYVGVNSAAIVNYAPSNAAPVRCIMD